jgi:hypothetical protein
MLRKSEAETLQARTNRLACDLLFTSYGVFSPRCRFIKNSSKDGFLCYPLTLWEIYVRMDNHDEYLVINISLTIFRISAKNHTSGEL